MILLYTIIIVISILLITVVMYFVDILLIKLDLDYNPAVYAACFVAILILMIGIVLQILHYLTLF